MNAVADIGFARRHLLGIEGLSAAEISSLLDLSDSYVETNRRPGKKSDVLRGRTVINLFFETSTRTRTSLELAGREAGGDEE
jgi:aspartate carbamoyltransferase catalytic subunit